MAAQRGWEASEFLMDSASIGSQLIGFRRFWAWRDAVNPPSGWFQPQPCTCIASKPDSWGGWAACREHELQYGFSRELFRSIRKTEVESDDDAALIAKLYRRQQVPVKSGMAISEIMAIAEKEFPGESRSEIRLEFSSYAQHDGYGRGRSSAWAILSIDRK